MIVVKLCVDPFNLTEDGGVVEPNEELRVDVDLAVGTVPLEPEDESVVRKLALDRLRKSLRKVMTCDLYLRSRLMGIVYKID